MTNIVTAVLLFTFATNSPPRQIDDHARGRVMETRHFVVRNWQLFVGDEPIAQPPIQTVLTNWVTLSIEPIILTNEVSTNHTPLIGGPALSNAVVKTNSQRKTRTPRPSIDQTNSSPEK